MIYQTLVRILYPTNAHVFLAINQLPISVTPLLAVTVKETLYVKHLAPRINFSLFNNGNNVLDVLKKIEGRQFQV